MKSSRRELRGVLPVFQTPYHEDETIDLGTLEKEIAWLYECGAAGIVMAMVSETLRLSSEEREELAAAACRLGSTRGVVVISVGAEATRLAERFAQHAEFSGADAVMAIPPVSVGISQGELAAYYTRILHAVQIPVIVQDASGYVGKPMPIDLQAQLLDQFGPERVLYKPEASPIGPKLSELREATKGRARVFEGTGGIALVDSFKRGIVGTMPGADLIRALVPLWRALQAGDGAKADRIHGPLAALISMQTSLDAFLAVEKHLLLRQGIFKNTLVRGPVGFRLDEETRREVDRLFERLMDATGQET
ncbi:MAG TPA: dihydrodipicolinate synthase family protein [Verrucomicrobiae bacterium]